MIALVVGLALFFGGLASLWVLHNREQARAGRQSPFCSQLFRYLLFGLGWVVGLLLTVLGGAIVFFAYADLAGR